MFTNASVQYVLLYFKGLEFYLNKNTFLELQNKTPEYLNQVRKLFK
jgi:hypothetical protein